MESIRQLTIERLEKFISDTYFTESNFCKKNFYTMRFPVDLTVFSPKYNYIPTFSEVIKEEFKPCSINSTYGPSWSTHWFLVKVNIPDSWKGEEIHFLWDSEGEATIWRNDGPTQGLNGSLGDDRRTEYILSNHLQQNIKLKQDFYVEMVCYGPFGVGKKDMIDIPDENRKFTLKQAEIGLFNRSAWNLYWILSSIIEMAKELPNDSVRGEHALIVANSMVNMIDVFQPQTWKQAEEIGRKFLSQKNGDSQLILYCCGNCHIDTAWLWSYQETRRKTARSWSSQLQLMNQNIDYKFCASQAQQFDWLRKDYPQLFDKIKFAHKSGQFLTVGGTWVEMDCNIPCGESLVRQFLYGQRFFKREFGEYCSVFFLPDTFGYASQLPQIILKAELKYFITQKISWNMINKFPYHTFIWQGLDGSQVLTHFPPADTYISSLSPKENLFIAKNYKNKGLCKEAFVLFGFGDGGGGPTRDHLERLKLLSNVDGLPKMKIASPRECFQALENYTPYYNQSSNNNIFEQSNQNQISINSLFSNTTLPVHVGDLYLEIHRGTYTTQSQLKLYNVLCERVLHDLEMIACLLLPFLNSNITYNYPQNDINSIWEVVLCNQFHDVIPGSCINKVVSESLQLYKQSYIRCKQLLAEALEHFLSIVTPSCTTQKQKRPRMDQNDDLIVVFNSLNFNRCECVEITQSISSNHMNVQSLSNDHSLVLLNSSGIGYNIQRPLIIKTPVKAYYDCDRKFFCLSNESVKIQINEFGHIISIVYNGINFIKETDFNNINGCYLRIYEDLPLYWDAWDLEFWHTQKCLMISKAESINIIEKGPIRASVSIKFVLGRDFSGKPRSWIKQDIRLYSHSPQVEFVCNVEWHESHRVLKHEFDLSLNVPHITYGVQYGHCERSNNHNTTQDIAQFEVCSQRWCDISENNLGISLITDSKFGMSCLGSRLSLTLLRSSKRPDNNADMGNHNFSYALLPHSNTLQDAFIPFHALAFSTPLIIIPSNVIPIDKYYNNEKVFFKVDKPSIIIDWIKKAEDSSSNVNCSFVDIILRLYEAYGGRENVKLTSNFPVKFAFLCTLLENNITELHWNLQTGCSLSFTPFQIHTIKLRITRNILEN